VCVRVCVSMCLRVLESECVCGSRTHYGDVLLPISPRVEIYFVYPGISQSESFVYPGLSQSESCVYPGLSQSESIVYPGLSQSESFVYPGLSQSEKFILK